MGLEQKQTVKQCTLLNGTSLIGETQLGIPETANVELEQYK